jgi:hypothetical protein
MEEDIADLYDRLLRENDYDRVRVIRVLIIRARQKAHPEDLPAQRLIRKYERLLRQECWARRQQRSEAA